MAKKTELQEDDDLDDLLDLDDLETDLDIPPPRDDRSPATQLLGGIKTAFNPKKHGISFLTKVVKGVLPKAYGDTLDHITDIKSTVNNIFDTAKEHLKPALSGVDKTVKRTLPTVGNFLPKKVTAALKELSTDDDNSDESSYSYSNDNPDKTEITHTLETIFGATRLENRLRDQRSDIIRKNDDDVQQEQFELTATNQVTSNEYLSRLVNYQDTVLDKYYRRSLELQHLHYYATRDILSLSKSNSAIVNALLENIVKNTGLPEDVKVQFNEQFKTSTKKRIIGSVQDRLNKRLGQLPQRLEEGIAEQIKGFSFGLKNKVNAFDQFSEMNEQGADMGISVLNEFGENAIGGDLRDSLGMSLGKLSRKKFFNLLESIRPGATDKINAGGEWLDNLTDNFSSELNSRLQDPNRSALFDFLGSIINPEMGVTESVNKNLRSEASAHVSWDMISRRSLIEIIPGYLSQSLQQLSSIYNILSGNPAIADKIVYDTETEGFVNEMVLNERNKKNFKRQISYRTTSNLNSLVDKIDDGSLTENERKELAIYLAQQSAKGIRFKPEDYIDSYNYPTTFTFDSSDKIANLFRNAFGITTEMGDDGQLKHKVSFDHKTQKKLNEASSQFREIRDQVGDFTDIYNKHNETGEKGLLRNIGAINSAGNVNPEFRWNLIRELLDAENLSNNQTNQASTENEDNGLPDFAPSNNRIKNEINNLLNQQEQTKPLVFGNSNNINPEIDLSSGGNILRNLPTDLPAFDFSDIQRYRRSVIDLNEVYHLTDEEKERYGVNDKKSLFDLVDEKISKGIKNLFGLNENESSEGETITPVGEGSAEFNLDNLLRRTQRRNDVTDTQVDVVPSNNETIPEQQTIGNTSTVENNITENDIDSEEESNAGTNELSNKMSSSLFDGLTLPQTIKEHLFNHDNNTLEPTFTEEAKENFNEARNKIIDYINTNEVKEDIVEKVNEILDNKEETIDAIKTSVSNTSRMMGELLASSKQQARRFSPIDNEEQVIEGEVIRDNDQTLIPTVNEIINRFQQANKTTTQGFTEQFSQLNNSVDKIIELMSTNEKESEDAKLIQLLKDYSEVSLAYLDRIANATEKGGGGIGNGNFEETAKPGLFRKTGQIIAKPFKLLNTVRKTIRPTVVATRNKLAKGVFNIAVPAAKFGYKSAVKLGNLGLTGAGMLARGVGSGLVKAPSRLFRAAKLLATPVGYMGKKVLQGGLLAGKLGLGLSKFAIRKTAEMAVKTPGRLIRSAAKLKTPIQFTAKQAQRGFNALGRLSGKIAGTADENFIGPKPQSFFSGLMRYRPNFGNKLKDVYTRGNPTRPVLYAEKLENGEYFDKITGKRISSFNDIRGEVVDRLGNVIMTTEDYGQGLIDSKGKPIYNLFTKAYKILGSKFPLNKRITNKLLLGPLQSLTKFLKAKPDTDSDDIVNKIKSGVKGIKEKINPFAFASKAVEQIMGVFETKEDKVVGKLTDIYNFMQRAWPLEDSETKEANRKGGVNDILRQKAEAKKAKAEKDKKKKENVNSSNSNNDDENNEENKESGGMWDSIKTGGSAIAGYLGLNKAGGLLTKLPGLFKAGATVAGAATAAGSIATGTAAAAETTAVGGGIGSLLAGTIASAGGTAGILAGIGATATGILTLSNPIGWALLAGAAAYGGYKAYKFAARRTALRPLEMLRYLQYGVPINNSKAVVSIRYFEEDVSDYIDLDNKQPVIDLSSEKLWERYYKEFGGSYDDKNDYKNFTNWFYQRFLPIYIKHTAVAKAYNNTKLEDVDDMDIATKLLYVNSIQFGETEAKVGMVPYTITASPWHDIALADNANAIKTLTEQIRNTAKSGEDISLDNLDKIKATVPKLSPEVTPFVSKLSPKYDINKNADAEKVAEGSLYEKTIDWSSRNIIEPVANTLGVIKTGIKDAGEKAYTVGKDLYGKSVDWTSTHIVEPIANSLAGLIKSAESGSKGYNAYNRGTTGGKILGPVGDRNLTSMTLAEIIADMNRNISDPERLFAVGKYQMIPSTLIEGIKTLGLNPSTTKYDEKTQELLFSKYLLDKKRPKISAFIKGKTESPLGAADSAAAEWASIADPKTGRSKYGHGNKASVSAEKIISALTASRNLYKRYIAEGLSEDEAYQKAVSTDGSAVTKEIPNTVSDTVAATTPGIPATSNLTSNLPGNASIPSTGPTINAASALTADTKIPEMPMVTNFPSFNSAGVTPKAINPLEVGKEDEKTLQNPLTTVPTNTAIVTEQERVLTPVPPTPVNVTTSQVDVKPIADTLIDVGSKAYNLGEQQLSEQQKLNTLMGQLIAHMSTMSKETVQNTQSSSPPASYPERSNVLTPIINLNRKL